MLLSVKGEVYAKIPRGRRWVASVVEYTRRIRIRTAVRRSVVGTIDSLVSAHQQDETIRATHQSRLYVLLMQLSWHRLGFKASSCAKHVVRAIPVVSPLSSHAMNLKYSNSHRHLFLFSHVIGISSMPER
jgi:hypothetical protein